MTIEQYFIGSDEDGVTEVSLEALEKIANCGMVLEKVKIARDDTSSIICSFIFKDHGIYNASGFSIGYGGEGPRGLHKAIRMFSDKIDEDFINTPIASLNPENKWGWKPLYGFISEE